MKLNYRILGEGGPLLILHGLFGMFDNWNSIAKQFSQHFKVVLIDLRNHGHSPHNNEWNYKVMSEDVLELIQSNNWNKVSIIGHSMGGKTAMQFAVDHCEFLNKMIVVDIAPKQYEFNQRDVVDALLSVDLNKITSRKEAEQELDKHIKDVGTKQFLLKNLYWKDEENQKLAWRFNLPVIAEKLDNVSDAIGEGKTCSAPVLFMRGEKSNYILDKDWKDIQNVFPNSQLTTISGAGHWVHAEKPKEMAEATLNFIGN